MKKNTKENRKSGYFALAVLMLISIFASGCVQKPTSGTASSFPISVGLDISRAPALGETAELTFTMTSLRDRHTFPNFSGEIILPEGLEYVSGNLSWEGDLLANQTVQFKAIVKAVKTGEWFVYAQPAAGYGDQIVLLISKNSARKSRNPFIRPSKYDSVVEANISSNPPKDAPTNVTAQMSEYPYLSSHVEAPKNLRPLLSTVLAAKQLAIAGVLLIIVIYIAIRYVKYKKSQNKGGQ